MYDTAADSFSASIASAAGPAYTVELAHPAYRGTMAGMYNTFWWLGNILVRPSIYFLKRRC